MSIIGDVNSDRIFAVSQDGHRQGINRSSYMSYLHGGYTLHEMIVGDTVTGGIGVVLGNKIIGPEDIRAVVYGTASIASNDTSSEGTEGSSEGTEGSSGTGTE